jgi:hypothetical protein
LEIPESNESSQGDDFSLSKPVSCDVMANSKILNCSLSLVVLKGLLAAICLESRLNNYAIYYKKRFGFAYYGWT